MKSLISLPINQTTKTVTSTTIEISETSDFEVLLFTEEYQEDRTSIILEETFIDTPLYIRITKTFDDGTFQEFADSNPIVRGKTRLVRENEFLSIIKHNFTESTVNGKTTLVISFNRPVDNIFVSVLRNDSAKLVTSKSLKDAIEITIELDNEDFLGTSVCLLISTSLQGISYKNITSIIPISNTASLLGVKDIYFTNTYTFIEVASTIPYKLYIDDKELPLAVTNRYNIREYLSYGKPSTIELRLNDGEVISKKIDTTAKPRGYNTNMVIQDTIEETGLVIDKTRVTHPTNGDIINNAMFYLITEDNREKLYSYYIPSDVSMKLDPSFEESDAINEIIHIDDGRLALVTTGTVDKITIFNYFLAPLSISNPVIIPLTGFANCKLTYLHLATAFFYIENDKMYKIDMLNNKTEISVPDTFTDGYISVISITELAVILDNVLYSYDTVTNDWDTIVTLPTDLSSKTYKYMMSIPEGTLIVCTDGTVYKYDKATSDFIKYNSVFTDVSSVFKSNHNILFTDTTSSKIYTFK